MSLDFNIMVGGEAGQGIQTMGAVLAKAMSRGGLHIFSDQDYESRIRGGHNFFRVRVRDREVMALSEKVDILLAMNKETIDLHEKELKSGDSRIIYDGSVVKTGAKDGRFLDVPLAKLAEDTVKSKLMSNSVAVGAAVGLVDYDFELLAGVLQEQFAKSGKLVQEANVKAAKAGYDYARQNGRRNTMLNVKPIGKGNR
ncbi:MAG: 2-oxoacid:acceptor oxidoreductase family protein, partial [Dehalococcoidia bacterium]|nr:2-oxoacid:acceptor oxidoreductase family protein [Dehalococcoidia bacterium]